MDEGSLADLRIRDNLELDDRAEQVDVSFAYSFQALGYILVTILAWMIFNEEINMLRIFALIIISIGLIILALSAKT